MKIFDTGFSTPLAITIIFSLCVITLSFCMIAATNERRIDSYRKALEERKKIDSVIFNIEEKIQSLKDLNSDTDEHEISFLIASVCAYDFNVSDVSTGINKNFNSEDFLKNMAIDECITACGYKAFSEYGWINPKLADKTILEQTAKDFDGKGVFPLVNSLPPYNIHNMSVDFIKAILEFCGIKEAEKKAELIKEKISSDTTVKELSEILAVAENHPVFDLIGTKTVFWKVDFETEKANTCAVFAAVPERENQKKIEKYILVEKKISLKGDAL